MEKHKSLHTDAAGRINLGKEYADKLFTVTWHPEQIVLEPARVIPEREFQARERAANRLMLSEQEWSRFQELLQEEQEPTEELRRLLTDKDQ